MIVYDGEIYFDEKQIEPVNELPGYAKDLYFAIAKTLARKPFGISRRKAAQTIQLSVRHLYRKIARFKEEGLSGLIHRSRRPKTSPKKTPLEEEDRILKIREASGFGPKGIAWLVKESFQRENKTKTVQSSTVYNILVRKGEIERERMIQNRYKSFEWGHPDRLIQGDLTKFNGVPILTMLDDHSRKGWAIAIPSEKDEVVIEAMTELHPYKYDNLLTDNGSQFNRKNGRIRQYCDIYLNEKHIWASIHHPQTLGKLSSYQKGLKRFLRHQVGRSRDRALINKWIKVYNVWYNNGRYHSSIKTVAEIRYSGRPKDGWYEQLVKGLKLESVLTIQRSDISP